MKMLGRDNQVAAIATTAAVVHCFVAVWHGGPVAVPDVSAYLSVSQWFAGGVLPDPLHFFPGYGVLLAPVGWLSGSALHDSALVFNGILAGCCVFGAATLAGKCGGSSTVTTGVAALAAVHPSISMASRIAWPETLLALAVLVVALLLWRDSWGLAGLTAGLAVAVHPRAIVFVIAISLLAVADRRIRPVLLGMTPGLAVSAILLHITSSWPWARLDAATSPGGGLGPVETISGQWLALSATSAGLAALGLIVSLRGVWNRTEPAAITFLGLSATVMLLLGGWVLAGSDRIDTLLYGRYIGPWVVPLTIVGLTAVMRGSITRRAVAAASVPTLVGFVVVLFANRDAIGEARRIMTLGLGALWAMFNGRFVPTLLAAMVLTVAGVLSARRGPLIPLTIVFALAISSTVTNHHHLQQVGHIADAQATAAELVPDDVTCLGHDASTKSYALWLYRLELPGMGHRRVDLAANEEPCSAYVVAADDALVDCSDADLLGTEPRAKWGLWYYPKQGCN